MQNLSDHFISNFRLKDRQKIEFLLKDCDRNSHSQLLIQMMPDKLKSIFVLKPHQVAQLFCVNV